MARDVLIVDDIKNALDNYANEIILNLSIQPFVADDPFRAFDILRDYPIKVLVTDQEMPGLTGTELVKKMRSELDIRIPCIMLTGHANNMDVVEASNLGFFRFIDKNNVHSQLPQAVREAIHHYDIKAMSNAAVQVNQVLSSRSSWLGFRPRVSLRLLRVSSMIDPYIHDDEWFTECTAQRNLSEIREVSIERTVATSYECGLASELEYKVGIKLKDLVATLESSLQNKTTISAKAKYESSMVVNAKHVFNITEIIDAPRQDGLILQSREYQFAPVYRRANCVLQLDCTCCKVPRVFDVSVDLPTKRIALRQVEYFDRGTPRFLYTGFLDGSLCKP